MARARVVEALAALKNQLCTAESKFLKRQLERRIVRADKDLAALDGEILKRIKADDGLARRYAILTSIPSFGFAVAATLIACLAEIGSLTAKQIGMLAGLAPIADQSGERDGIRVIWGGRPAVRRVLYLAALSAHSLQCRHEGLLQASHNQRKTRQSRTYRCRQKTRRPRKYPRPRRSSMGASHAQARLTPITDAPPLRFTTRWRISEILPATHPRPSFANHHATP